MKEYGNEDSWCILHSVVDNPVFDQPPQVVRCLGMLDGQILMLVNGSGLTWVDPRNGRVEVVPIPGFTNASKFEAVLCLESQVKTFPAEDYETRDDDIRTETSEAESSEE
ncbi:unnamed protein product [Linum tenue]|uniref:Uncharacterized protein n=1 Tax=Linum tenue TaxID=586396 RepID=A0AAV0N693_9ROSI|nr:unnamed protein product [Linum tenue]